MARQIKELENRGQYQGAASGGSFNPVKVPDFSQQIYANQSIGTKNMERSMDAFNQYSDVKTKELGELAKFSQSLINFGVTALGIKNQSDFEAAQNYVFENGYHPQQQQAYDAEVEKLKAADGEIQKSADKLKQAGAPYDAVHMIRNSSGWYRYGLEVAHATATADEYDGWLNNKLLSDNETEVTLGDKTFKVSEARTSEEKRAAIYVLRSQYMRETGLMGMHPGLLNKYSNTKMKSAESKLMSEVQRKEEGDMIDERKNNAINALTVSLRGKDYSAFGVAVDDLRRYMSAKDARKLAMDHLYQMMTKGLIDDVDIERIRNTKFAGPIGDKTWGQAFESEWMDAEMRAYEARSKKHQLEVGELKLNAQLKEDQVLQDLQGKRVSAEQVQSLIDALNKESQGYYEPTRLKDFLENQTVDAEIIAQQKEVLQNMYRDGTLDSNELMSGKYHPTLEDAFRAKAQEGDQKRQENISKADPVLLKGIDGLINQKVGVFDDNSTPHHSASLVKLEARTKLHRYASDMMRNGKASSWEQAYSMAYANVTQEIENGGRYKVVGKGPNARFAYFSDATVANASIQAAQQEQNRLSGIIKNNGNAFATNAKDLFTNDELRLLSNPNNAGSRAHLKLRQLLDIHNKNNATPITYDAALRTTLGGAGLKLERPYKLDIYQNLADISGLMELITSPTPARVARLSAQGGLVPPIIRNGVEGSKDIMQAAVALGLPPQLAPLAAAVWASETGWGQAVSGTNNIFAIKGKGDTINTYEYVNGQRVSQQASFTNYNSKTESIQHFVDLMTKEPRYAAVLQATTPRQALKSMLAAGYATDPNYQNLAEGTLQTMGIAPDKPYNFRPLTNSPWSSPALMGPSAREFISGNSGSATTGAHLHAAVKVDGRFIEPSAYMKYVLANGKPLLNQSKLYPMTSPYGPRPAPCSVCSSNHKGIDYAMGIGTRISVVGGRYVETYESDTGGITSVYQLPDGAQMLFMHGDESNLKR